MITDGDLTELREMQTELMFDTVQIDRKTGSVWDEEAQQHVDSWEPVYRGDGGGPGPARVALPHGAPVVTASGEVVVPRTALVTIPWGNSPAEGDRVTVADPPPGVPSVVWVQAVEAAGLPTACRMACGAL